MILSDLYGHSSIASLFKRDFPTVVLASDLTELQLA